MGFCEGIGGNQDKFGCHKVSANVCEMAPFSCHKSPRVSVVCEEKRGSEFRFVIILLRLLWVFCQSEKIALVMSCVALAVGSNMLITG